jgi:hypothetical protein
MLRPSLRKRAMAPWARLLWTRVLSLVLLFVVTPGSLDVVQEVVSYAVGIECCVDDGCGGTAGQCCPQSCLHCPCLRRSPIMTHLCS